MSQPLSVYIYCLLIAVKMIRKRKMVRKRMMMRKRIMMKKLRMHDETDSEEDRS